MHVAAPLCKPGTLYSAIQSLSGRAKKSCIALTTKLSVAQEGCAKRENCPWPDNDTKRDPPGGEVCNCLLAVPESFANQMQCRLDDEDNDGTCTAARAAAFHLIFANAQSLRFRCARRVFLTRHTPWC